MSGIFARRDTPSRTARAVVTGAGSGIGRAIALELGRRGGDVLCADIDEDAARKSAADIERNGRRASPIRCDVSSRDDVTHLAATAKTYFDEGPTLLVNNAGIGVGGLPVGEQSLEDWEAALNVNLIGAIHCAHYFAPVIRRQTNGGILTIASAASYSAAPLMAAYNVTKAGVLALSETVRTEMAGTDIHVTAVCPTFVKTAIVENGRITDTASSAAAKLMARSGMTAERVAQIALDGLDRDRPYVMPQFDARAIWRFKRFMPGLYGALSGALANSRLNDFKEPGSAEFRQTG